MCMVLCTGSNGTKSDASLFDWYRLTVSDSNLCSMLGFKGNSELNNKNIIFLSSQIRKSAWS